MGTRSVVARPTESGGFEGRYIHWDGYPEGVGAALKKIVDRVGPEEALSVLTTEHYGWSSVTGEDEVELPEYLQDGRFVAVPGYGIAYTTEQGQSSADDWITDENLDPVWIEYVYVIHSDRIDAFSTDMGGEMRVVDMEAVTM